jgi:hypothetical protein
MDPTGLGPIDLAGTARWALANVHAVGNNGFNDDDCTDFASRAMHFGGLLQEDVPFSPLLQHTDDRYWFRVLDGFFTENSYSWGGAKHLAHHFHLIKSHWLVNAQSLRNSLTVPTSVKPGDIIFANWTGAAFNGISHTGIITSINNGVPMITQHSNDLTESLSFWHQKNPGAFVWVVQPNS